MCFRSFCTLSLLLFATCVYGIGEEDFGNAPLNSANYVRYPGVAAVINDSHRVYRSWVNGNENFYFAGDSIGVNAALDAFSAIQADRLEVVLRPQPGQVQSLDHSQQIKFQWSLQLIGGIAAHLSSKDRAGEVWPTHPVMSIYVGGPVQLVELDIPDNVDVIELSELHRRYRQGLHSSDQDVRGWTCGRLAALDPYNIDSMQAIAKLLDDRSVWVQENAAAALAEYGSRASAVVPQLRAAKVDAASSLIRTIDQTLAAISTANDNARAAEAFRQTLSDIQRFCQWQQR